MARGRNGQTKVDLVTASVLPTTTWEHCHCSLLLRRISIQCRHLGNGAAMALTPRALIYQACGSQQRTAMFLHYGSPFIIDLPGRVYSSWKMESSTFRHHSREQEQYHTQAVSWPTIDYSVPVNLENILFGIFSLGKIQFLVEDGYLLSYFTRLWEDFVTVPTA